MKFGTGTVCNVTRKRQKKIKIVAIEMMTSFIMSIFLKNYTKND